MKNLGIFVIMLALGLQSRAAANSDFAGQNKLKDQALVEVSTARYIIGGVTGTIAGFGTGHIVQGRYIADRGWIFSAGEGAPVAILLAGGAWAVFSALMDPCMGDANTHEECRGPQKSHDNPMAGGSTVTALATVFVAFKIWETVDIWNHSHGSSVNGTTSSESLGTTAQVAVMPTGGDSLGAGLVLRF
jgi:hypothetical protein